LFVPPLSYPVNLSTIQDLPLTASGVDVHLSVGEVARLLERHPDWPGVILTAQGRFVGLLTRRACSEFLGNMLGTRIFSEVSIFAFFKKYGAGGLILDGGVSVEGAVRAARDDRQGDAVHDPIVVCQGQCQYGLLDMPVLLKAQAIL
jgi:hypothetical protein